MNTPASTGLTIIEKLHSRLVLGRRMRVLAKHLGDLMPEQGVILDVGCGNGTISSHIMAAKPGLTIHGIDVHARPHCAIPMQCYDGDRFPFESNSFDVVMFVDVLHHTNDPIKLLHEAKRVARRSIVLKDHPCDSPFARQVLSVMDWVGNKSHGVTLPYNYLSSSQWSQAWRDLGLEPDIYLTKLSLYPWWVRPLFEHGLHFVARIPVDTSR